ncbi:MAG: GGDEF domain-containing protein, partial [Gemmatimonadaceae bacterium]|nr:GGDEF domain-containing protein [Gemmatimonadaceae bacterium]
IVPGDFRATLEAPTAPDAQGNVPRVRGQLLATGGALVDVEVTSGPCTYHDQTGVVILARDISQQLRHEFELQELALYDDLTGLHNRRGFMLFAEQELARARRDKRAPMIVFADLDKLKEINDNHGHLAGDAALTLFAAAFKSVLRETDIVARWGGDEFVALLGEGGEGAIEQLEPRLGGAISALTKPGTKYRVRATVGSSSIDPARSLTEAIERADTELYQHKKR